ncbi:hypothetical protein [Deinococcus apachensis]|uniref:hypothetical protein n=1 Tax=Deinococcus apachensis TaxID=309886 RepID=UPI00039FE1DA|nr:hypothetical protein [Deinococcus apachensis]
MNPLILFLSVLVLSPDVGVQGHLPAGAPTPTTFAGRPSPRREVPLLNPVGVPGFTVPIFGTEPRAGADGEGGTAR